ncbi:SSU ribosomal protein S8p (S15Ae) [Olavius algarvensis spirochete endosymbiont]|uniref:30S ribosomal protein S8 n=1 Tax=Olavius algarvensis spirochete endosymbiont TaxID=260710 RepID=UPI000F16C322|nr:30S ribosomal protein S8 [Olavius algarvensis spirochete endosymbiont]CAD7844081.1 MAG: SSU ribosomal protein S8p (S15Ae) [Olavius algarvensis spirochete endosymbiont]VDB01104.1 SSU ribosomal protein S8p (S15Ae) [Olavius algarvensis spirochete endosymbiont]
MSVSDPVADMLTMIRNSVSVKSEKVDIRPSKLKMEIIKILKNEGYVKNFKKITQGEMDIIRVFMKYDEKEQPTIHGIKSVSTPGRRVYSGYKNMPRVFNGLGTVIVSTSAGVTTGKKAVLSKVGGEIICTVW